jgi:hypothetical protein
MTDEEKKAGMAFRGHLRTLDEIEMEISALEKRADRNATDELELRLLRIQRRLFRKWARRAQREMGAS